MSKDLKEIAGIFMIIIGTILAAGLAFIILELIIYNPSFDLFSVIWLFLVPALLIGVGYEMLNSTDKKEDDTK